MPNIKIFPIDDVTDYQQQVISTSPVTSYRDDYSNNPISSARSLPDIANLRVSSGAFTQMAPSYSDQRIPEADYLQDYNYDANSNIVTDTSAHTPYCSLQADSSQQVLETNNSWHLAESELVSGDFNQTNTHSLHQDYYANNQSQPCTTLRSTRANSTNAVLSSWHNTDTLNTPRLSNNLSKSFEGGYGYLDDHQVSTDCNNPNISHQNQPSSLTDPTMMMRSSSYNNIENIGVRDDRVRNSAYSTQHQQQMFDDKSLDCRFYE